MSMAKSAQQRRVQRYMRKIAEIASSLLLIALFITVFILILRYIIPFVLGGIMAVLLLPTVRWLERRGLPRTPAVWVAMIGVGLILCALGVFAAIAIANEATTLSNNLSPYFLKLQGWVVHPTKLRALFFGHIPPQVTSQIQTASVHLLSGIEQWFRGFVALLLHLVTQFPDWLFIIGIALLAAYFMLVDRGPIYHRFLSSLPPGWDRKVSAALNDMVRAFMQTIRVQLILMGLSAVLAMLAMWILGIQYAFILGLLFGLSGLIPIVGSAIITVPWAIGAFVIGDTPLAVKVLVIQGVITLVVHLITPKITANSVGLDTLSTLFSLYVGMKLIGFIGIFIGPIVLIGIKSFMRKRPLVDLFPDIEPSKPDESG
jgi:sporulation integral membrane protein YtvI